MISRKSNRTQFPVSWSLEPGPALVFLAASVTMLWFSSGYAQSNSQIRTDSSWDRAPTAFDPVFRNRSLSGNNGVTHPVPGNVYQIPETVGRIRGGNLFHSFEQLSIGSRDAAVFTTSTPNLGNVIARVTGGSVSQINGLLMLTAAGNDTPAFFLVNPSGVTFGPGARVDVPGSFHVSTATTMLFDDGTELGMERTDSALTMAPPSAFGFALERAMAPILIQGGATHTVRSDLRILQPANSITSFTARDVEIRDVSLTSGAMRLTAVGSGSRLFPLNNQPENKQITGRLEVLDSSLAATSERGITLEGGIVRVSHGTTRRPSEIAARHIEVKGEESVLLEGSIFRAGPRMATSEDRPAGSIVIESAGVIDILGGSEVSVIDAGARGIRIDAGEGLSIVESTVIALSASRLPTTSGAALQLRSGGLIRVAGDCSGGVAGCRVGTDATRSATGGSLTVAAREIEVDGATLFTGSRALDGGDLILEAETIHLRRGAALYTDTQSLRAQAGEIHVSASRVTLGDAEVFSRAGRGSSGRLGDVFVSASESLSLSRGNLLMLNEASPLRPAEVATALLSVDAGNLITDSGSRIRAYTTGNVAPASVLINGLPQGRAEVTRIRLDGSWDRSPRNLEWRESGSEEGGPVEVRGGGFESHLVYGRVYYVEEGDGNLVGNSLFHSFDQFDLAATDAALFMISTPTVEHVISRVTGRLPSRIDGLLAVVPESEDAARPGFYFINPAGVMLGASVRLDVPASLHLATADRLVFENGDILTAGQGANGEASDAFPQGLGFDDKRYPSHIVVGEAAAVAPGALRFDFSATVPGSSLSFIGGAVSVSSMNLEVLDGDLRVVGVGNFAIEVPLSGSVELAALGGGVELNQTALQGGRGGTLVLEGGDLQIHGSSISAVDSWKNPITLRSSGDVRISTSLIESVGFAPSEPVPSIMIEAGGLVSMDDAAISTFAFDINDAGIHLKAHSMQLGNVRGPSQVRSIAAGVHTLGGVTLAATHDILLDNVDIASEAVSGTAGPIRIEARNLIVGTTNKGTITSEGFGSANAGRIDIRLAGELFIRNGTVRTTTFGTNDAGSVAVRANRLVLGDELNSGEIGSIAEDDDDEPGTSGHIDLVIAEDTLIHQGKITTETSSFGPGGGIDLTTGTLVIRSRGAISSDASGAGDAGTIRVRAGRVELLGGGRISTTTMGAGAAGAIQIESSLIVIDGPGSGFFSAATDESSGQSGNIAVHASAELRVEANGAISIRNDAIADPSVRIAQSALTVEAPVITLLQGGILSAESHGNVAPSRIVIKADTDGTGTLLIRGDSSGSITTNTTALLREGEHPPRPGTSAVGGVEVFASDVLLYGVNVTSETAGVTLRPAGEINVRAAETLRLSNGTVLSVRSSGNGTAGNIALQAKDILIEDATVSSGSDTGATGDAGRIGVHAQRSISIRSGGTISSSTSSSGAAGSIDVVAAQVHLRDTGSSIQSSVLPGSSGLGGDIAIVADELVVERGAMVSATTSAVVAHPERVSPSLIRIVAPSVAMDGGRIEAVSRGNVSAGNVQIETGSGEAFLHIRGEGGLVSTSTFGEGTGGQIRIMAGDIELDDVQITSNVDGGTGDAGSVLMQATGLLTVRDAKISADTIGAGDGGSVDLDAEDILIERSEISSRASGSSTGRTGDITIRSRNTLGIVQGSKLTIRNDALDTVESRRPNILSLAARDIAILDSTVSAESTGRNDASNIDIRFRDRLFIDPSLVVTIAREGNGGAISIEGGGIMSLVRSQISTSVLGLSGNGGDINIEADTLLLDSGFIQANTTAPGALGGNISIDSRTLLYSGVLLLEGDAVRAFDPSLIGVNVIQAAAPSGVSGVVASSTPPVDVAGSVRTLTAEHLTGGGVLRDPCRSARSSSFAIESRGGFRPTVTEVLRTEGSYTRLAAFNVVETETAGVIQRKPTMAVAFCDAE